MGMTKQPTFVAFRDHRLLARGTVEDIVRRLHPRSASEQAELRLLDETTGRVVDFDWRGSADDIVVRTNEQLAGRGRGRPKLGVESREITLLPRHWHWLDEKGRSASATLRNLIDQAMGEAEPNHVSIDALYWQMSTLAGDLPGFEEATRNLYAFDWDAAERIVSTWPEDLSRYFIERLHAAANTGRGPS